MEESGKYQHILEAAMDLFSERGFETTSVQDIAQTAGIAKGTVYLYFKSKEDLVQQVYRYCYDMDIRACEEGVEEQKNTIDKLCRRMDNIIDYLLSHPKEARIEQMYQTFSSAREHTHYYREEMYKAIEKVVKEGSEKGELRDLPVSLLSRFITGSPRDCIMAFSRNRIYGKAKTLNNSVTSSSATVSRRYQRNPKGYHFGLPAGVREILKDTTLAFRPESGERKEKK